jgi:hypothetical protein
MCPHTTKKERCYICVLILRRKSSATYVSSYYYICYICVRTLLYLQTGRGQGREVSGYICDYMCPHTTASHTTIYRCHICVLILLFLYVSSYYCSLYCYICRQSEGESEGLLALAGRVAGQHTSAYGEESDAPLPRKQSAALKNSIVPVKAAPSAFYISDFTRELWAAAGAFTHAFAP